MALCWWFCFMFKSFKFWLHGFLLFWNEGRLNEEVVGMLKELGWVQVDYNSFQERWMKNNYDIIEVNKSLFIFCWRFHYSPASKTYKTFFGFLFNKNSKVFTLDGEHNQRHNSQVVYSLDSKIILKLEKWQWMKTCQKLESQMISQAIKWMKAIYRESFFAMADGIMGKVGYVYQASNFYFGKFFDSILHDAKRRKTSLVLRDKCWKKIVGFQTVKNFVGWQRISWK